MAFNGCQVAQVACITQEIEINDAAPVLRNPMQNKVGSNESGPAGNENWPCPSLHPALNSYLDTITNRCSIVLTPGPEQREFRGMETAHAVHASAGRSGCRTKVQVARSGGVAANLR